MKIALLQMNTFWECKDKNIEKAESLIKKASENNCDVAVLPEMFNTGFSMNVLKVAENENSKTDRALRELSKKFGIYIIAGYAIKYNSEEKGKNIAAVYNKNGERIASYVKIHPFSNAKENEFYFPGDEVVIFKINDIPSSVFICYDLRFPEIFRAAARNVYIIFVIANWPLSRINHWNTLLKARAIENQCFIVGVNRIGIDGNNIFYNGSSQIISPLGEIVAKADETKEFIFSEINPHDVKEIRKRFPFLSDIKFSFIA